MKTRLSNVTLFGLDCVGIGRQVQAAQICTKDFGDDELTVICEIATLLPTARSRASRTLATVPSSAPVNDFE